MQIDLLQPHGERIILFYFFYITEVKWKVHANHKKCCNFTSAAAAAIYNCDCGHAQKSLAMKFDSSIKKIDTISIEVEYDSVLYAQMS